MKYVVVGGAGFIGSNIVDGLLEQEHEVVVIDNLSTGTLTNVNPHAQLEYIDICNTDECDNMVEIMNGADTVFLLAAKARVQPSIEEPVEYEMNNTMLFITALVFNTIALKLFSFITEIKFQEVVKGAFIITIGIVTILYLFKGNGLSPILSDKCKGKSLKEFVKKELKDRGYTKVSIFKPMIENTVKENYKDETYWFVDINAKIKMGDITLPKKERLICQCLSEQGFGWVVADNQQRY